MAYLKEKVPPGTALENYEYLFTLEEIATLLGVCRQRVRQLELRALRKIRAEIMREAEAAGVSPREWFAGG